MAVERVYGYDDIVLVPSWSEIRSRSDVDLSVDLGRGIELKLPIIAAPMDTVCGSSMAMSVARAGGIGIIHRYLSVEMQREKVRAVHDSGLLVGFACGVKNTEEENYRVGQCVDAGADLVCIDVAHGATEMVAERVDHIRNRYPELHIMIGNIATGEQLRYLIASCVKNDSFFDSVRVGIGGGSMCSTSRDTGFGLPTVSSIEWVYECRDMYSFKPKIIADGGIKYTGDMVKAFAVGADAVMLGSLLSGWPESCGEVIEGGYKKFRGMASAEARMDFDGTAPSHVEGVSSLVEVKDYSVEKFLSTCEANIKSGLTYVGAASLDDFKEDKPEYNIVTAAGHRERLPR
jgi:IMP dehydrogenase